MRRLVRTPPIWGALALVLVTALVTATVLTMRGDADAAPPLPLRIAVVGGYETVGTQNLVVWPTLLAQQTGWAVSNSALPDAGYVADGRGGYAFTYQVDRALAGDPDIVLVVGGSSDAGTDPERVDHGITEVLGKLDRSGVRTLVIGPTWYETPVPDAIARLATAIGDGADAAGLSFCDALDPPWLTPDLMRSDDTGPTDAGQAVLADRIAAWLHTEVDT
ncbi:SGNH/GDSL hydrolase family protein [Aldersonia sp. NBC_00410]|uniref:SGNH/GDSL hydrolase family protein n=1 Tax=Aldersonia sp. NBC_00410 TaxID=2975954 RepID=UPI00225747C0|nr:GDSL-type esterase/lipase family protein [Aldersonia sp. NBC_00410]MCX5041695.1 SGNH/GDSL hydrolase family protein [Aldersonia sp. NBC_00410]